MQRLAELRLRSAYHAHTGEAQGAESRATFYNHNGTRPAHIDFVFLPAAWPIERVEVGADEAWRVSDHRPVIVDAAPPAVLDECGCPKRWEAELARETTREE